MNASRHALFTATATLPLLLGACGGPNPPLMFGDSTTFGLRLGNDTASAGGGVSLGYKAQSVAVVPVSVLAQSGQASLLPGTGGSRRDGMSVFAAFESASPQKTSGTADTVSLGQVFSTGLASQELTRGYLCREQGDATCSESAAAVEAAAPADPPADPPTNSTGDKVAEPPPAAPPDARDQPYQSPLLFLRTDVIGIDIGGSLAEQGLQFSLGYNSRSLALIPVVIRSAGGRVDRISSSDSLDANTAGARDALSVLGQFKTNTSTARLGFGLERFFATGVAARNLGESLRQAIAKTAPAAATPAAGGASTPAN